MQNFLIYRQTPGTDSGKWAQENTHKERHTNCQYCQKHRNKKINPKKKKVLNNQNTVHKKIITTMSRPTQP